MTSIPSARLTLLPDLKSCKVGDSVRIAGIWEKYDANTNTAIVAYEGYEVEIYTANVDLESTAEGEIVQCLGEVIEAEINKIRIDARIVVSASTLNLELFQRVVKFRNESCLE